MSTRISYCPLPQPYLCALPCPALPCPALPFPALPCPARCPRQYPIARRSDMLVMSAEGPINAFVNAHGFVHETLTLKRARGLVLEGSPETENSWFPG